MRGRHEEKRTLEQRRMKRKQKFELVQVYSNEYVEQ